MINKAGLIKYSKGTLVLNSVRVMSFNRVLKLKILYYIPRQIDMVNNVTRNNYFFLSPFETRLYLSRIFPMIV